MSYEQIEIRREGSVGIVVLSREEKLNAFTRQMLAELLDALDVLDKDDSVRAVVFVGKGRAFCAGADLSSGGKTFDRDTLGERSDATLRDGGGQLTLRIFEMRKPVIAAINGAAVGVGMTMTLPMDVRLCTPEAKLGFVFTRRGIVNEAASSWFLPRIVGISTAAEWVYSGRIFTGTEALDRGLVHSLHAPDEILPAAIELAQEMTKHSSGVAIALCRQMIWRSLGLEHPMRTHEIDSLAMFHMGKSADAVEGIEAFKEKRQAVFPMSVSRDTPDIGLPEEPFQGLPVTTKE